MSISKKKLKEVFESTVEDGSNKYEGIVGEINYYNLFCKAAADDKLYKIQQNNFCMFNYYYNQIESVLMIFAIPINPSEDVGIKQVAERVMKIVRELENCFITLDYLNANEVVEDKFIYVIAVKKIEINLEPMNKL